MSERPFKENVRGRQPSASELNRLGEMVEGVYEASSNGGVLTRIDRSGPRIFNIPAQWFWARIASSGPPYDFVQQGDTNGTFADDTANGITASASAYEVSGSTTVALNSIVQMWLAASGDHYLFKEGLVDTKARFILFTLVATLAVTDATQANVTVNLYWGGSNPGATVTVSNLPASTNYVFSGASGHKGMAIYDDVNNLYRIVQMECP